MATEEHKILLLFYRNDGSIDPNTETFVVSRCPVVGEQIMVKYNGLLIVVPVVETVFDLYYNYTMIYCKLNG